MFCLTILLCPYFIANLLQRFSCIVRRRSPPETNTNRLPFHQCLPSSPLKHQVPLRGSFSATPETKLPFYDFSPPTNRLNLPPPPTPSI